MNKRSYKIDPRGDVQMPQQEPEKKSAPAAQPIDMPDDEVLYELADPVSYTHLEK